MCLIYYRDANHAPIDYRALYEAYCANPDGVGLAWFTDQWHVWRSIDASWQGVLKRLRALDGKPLVCHFRWATHGGCDLDNCHPFAIAPETYLFHNGQFAGVGQDESDTKQVAQRMAAIVAHGGRLVDAWRLVKLLADGNRLLLTLPGGRVARAGKWTKRPDGWYSNGLCLRHAGATDRSFAAWHRDFC
jgi:hypothetical protein